MRSYLALPLILILSLQPSVPQAADEVIVASAIDKSLVAIVSETILTRAYKALGYTLRVEYVPGLRALQRSNSGRTDAELVRTIFAVAASSNLVQVPESLFDVQGMAFVTDDTLVVRNQQDLIGHRIGLVRGVLWATEMTVNRSPRTARDAHDLFELLATREIDIALAARLTGQAQLKKFAIRGITMIDEPLTSVPVFHFLNNKHRNLGVPLADEIRKMKERGEIALILSAYLKVLN